MTETARQFQARLRVAILASETERRLALLKIVAQMASIVVVPVADADVVLSDGAIDSEDGVRVVAIGNSSVDPAGLLPPEATAAQIEAAMHAVAAGLRVRASETSFEAASDTWPSQLLTPREIEVLAAMAKGQSNKEIARLLAISLHTVKFHIEAIFRKLGVRSRTEAVAHGLRHFDL